MTDVRQHGGLAGRAASLGGLVVGVLLFGACTWLGVRYIATEREFEALKRDLETNLPVGTDYATVVAYLEGRHMDFNYVPQDRSIRHYEASKYVVGLSDAALRIAIEFDANGRVQSLLVDRVYEGL